MAPTLPQHAHGAVLDEGADQPFDLVVDAMAGHVVAGLDPGDELPNPGAGALSEPLEDEGTAAGDVGAVRVGDGDEGILRHIRNRHEDLRLVSSIKCASGIPCGRRGRVTFFVVIPYAMEKIYARVHVVTLLQEGRRHRSEGR